jgi:prepilin-type N-terminal cleavage/methylation domain-containing protein
MKKSSLQSGFTLVELLVSLALFSIVVVAAVASLYTVNSASQRVTAMRTVLDNLNFATESMSRTIRTGENIVCGGVDTGFGGPNCPFGTSTGGQEAISLDSTIDGSSIEYRWRIDTSTNNYEIQKCILTASKALDPNQCVTITDPGITIQQLKFYVDGADASDGKQPGVMIQMRGIANAGPNNIQPFAIQTYISQRAGE